MERVEDTPRPISLSGGPVPPSRPVGKIKSRCFPEEKGINKRHLFLLPGRHVGKAFSNLAAEEVLGVAPPHILVALRRTQTRRSPSSQPWLETRPTAAEFSVRLPGRRQGQRSDQAAGHAGVQPPFLPV